MRSLFLRSVRALLFAVAIYGEPSLANESKAEPVPLPHNWPDLKRFEKYHALRDSPHLVRGRNLVNVDVDCRERRITERDTGVGLRFYYPTSEAGSYNFRTAQGRLVTGPLEVLSSGERSFDRIFVLKGATTSENGRGVPHTFGPGELARIASLFETHQNQCVTTHGHHIEVYVFLARRDG